MTFQEAMAARQLPCGCLVTKDDEKLLCQLHSKLAELTGRLEKRPSYEWIR